MYETQSGMLIDSPGDGHLDWFHFLAAVNLAAVSRNVFKMLISSNVLPMFSLRVSNVRVYIKVSHHFKLTFVQTKRQGYSFMFDMCIASFPRTVC